ncbi:class A beta-lactamase [Halomonas endophytica]|uniref:Beta-lactamase n=1 Tax=Billgrantia endophytica TaxID=2033802 RepID=A0A2N7UC14_9GAMM|nr:SCO family class A beta-lactamase [Halomonas endophytica]
MLAALFSLLCATQSQLAGAAENLIFDAARQTEARLDARVGLAIYDTGSGASWLYNADERFPMASTFKVLACGALLARSDAGYENRNRLVPIVQSDLVTYSPVTEGWLGQEVSLDALCAATMRTSDNTAANKVLEALGGPDAVTAFLRSIGDEVTRLDRWETELNEATPGDLRDTTTPAAMANSLQRLLLGDALSPSAKATLTEWLVGNEVGEPLLRAGIPDDWHIGDRTGAGGHGSRGVVAIVWPPERAPLIAAIYITQTEASMEQRNEAIATIGRALAKTVRATP